MTKFLLSSISSSSLATSSYQEETHEKDTNDEEWHGNNNDKDEPPGDHIAILTPQYYNLCIGPFPPSYELRVTSESQFHLDWKSCLHFWHWILECIKTKFCWFRGIILIKHMQSIVSKEIWFWICSSYFMFDINHAKLAN